MEKSELKNKLYELENEARNIREQIKEISKTELFEKHNVNIGSRVIVNGKHGRITNNDGSYLFYSPDKKDGTEGVRETKIWMSFDKLEVINQYPPPQPIAK